MRSGRSWQGIITSPTGMDQGEAPSGLSESVRGKGQGSQSWLSAIPERHSRRLPSTRLCEPLLLGPGVHLSDSTIPFPSLDFQKQEWLHLNVPSRNIIHRRAQVGNGLARGALLPGWFPFQTCPFLQYPILISPSVMFRRGLSVSSGFTLTLTLLSYTHTSVATPLAGWQTDNAGGRQPDSQPSNQPE